VVQSAKKGFSEEQIIGALTADPERPVYIRLTHKSVRRFQDSYEQAKKPQKLVFEENALHLEADNLGSIRSLLSMIRKKTDKPVFFVHDDEIIPEHEFIINVDDLAQLKRLPHILHNARPDEPQSPYNRARLVLLSGSLAGLEGMEITVSKGVNYSRKGGYLLVFDPIRVAKRTTGFVSGERSALAAISTRGIELRTGFPPSECYPVSIRVSDPEQNISFDDIKGVPSIRAVITPPQKPDKP
tara:strand:- start:5676 stop:6401 length:726 start_codon:yes stop_codon:yes gene_type:complete